MSEAKHKYLVHQYPNFMLKNPKLMFWMYLYYKCVHVRIWYVLAVLKKELKQLKAQDSFVDIGCGEGQYSLALKKHYPLVNFILVDKLSSNIEFAQLYINACKLKNTKAYHKTVEEYSIANTNLSICVGVFQYIQEQEKAMQNIYSNTVTGGKLIFYVPINGRFVFKAYQYILEKYPNYESLNNRKRVYTYAQAVELVKNAGFTIEQQQFTYGFFGIVANELLNMQVVLLQNVSNWLKPFLYVLLLLSLHLIIICNCIDYFLPKKNGNGLLLVAVK